MWWKTGTGGALSILGAGVSVQLWAAMRSQEWGGYGYVLSSYYYTAVNIEDSVQSADTAVSVTARTCSNCSVKNYSGKKIRPKNPILYGKRKRKRKKKRSN
jgi:hypothetical protein